MLGLLRGPCERRVRRCCPFGSGASRHGSVPHCVRPQHGAHPGTALAPQPRGAGAGPGAPTAPGQPGGPAHLLTTAQPRERLRCRTVPCLTTRWRCRVADSLKATGDTDDWWKMDLLVLLRAGGGCEEECGWIIPDYWDPHRQGI